MTIKNRRVWVLVCFLVVLSLVVTLVNLIFDRVMDQGMCSEDVLRKISSPDQQRIAEAYVMSCGATTGDVTHVFIHDANQALTPNSSGVLAVEYEVCRAERKVGVKLQWLSNQQLQIQAEDDGELNCLSRFRGVVVSGTHK